MTNDDRPGAAERVCIVLLTGLGDVVHGLPVANALKDADPRREITWVAEPMPASILERHPSVDRVVRYERRQGWRGVVGLRHAMGEARRAAGAPFDLTLNLNVYFKSVWPVLFSRGRRRVSFGPDRARDGVWLAANDRLPAR